MTNKSPSRNKYGKDSVKLCVYSVKLCVINLEHREPQSRHRDARRTNQNKLLFDNSLTIQNMDLRNSLARYLIE